VTNGWKPVASLGAHGARFPEILVDNHGWCLRLGPSPRKDEKYYSSFSNLLQGLVEHVLRRRLKSGDILGGFKDLARRVEEALREAGELSRTAKECVIHEHIRRCGALTAPGPRPGGAALSAAAESPDRPEGREVLAAV